MLELAGLPSKEALPQGYIPAKKELDLIVQSYFDLWILYFNNTRPYPLDEAGRRRLRPLARYEEYRRRRGELIEIRHDHRREKPSRRFYTATGNIPPTTGNRPRNATTGPSPQPSGWAAGIAQPNAGRI